MSKSAATTDSRCRFPGGAIRAVLTAMALLPCAALAADSVPGLRSSDQVDLRRLGKVSEDERSVLRMEWRAGMAGVEEIRSVQDILDKLQRLETGIGDVSQQVRNMPATPAAAATAPVATTDPAAGEAPGTDDYDIRLMVANTAALALLALWWFRRRSPVAQPGTSLPPPPPQQAPPAAAKLQTAAAPLVMQPATATVTAPTLAPPPPEPAAWPAPVAVVAAPRPSEAPPEAAALAPMPPEPEPGAPFDADKTMVFDFSLEEADPETVARENARLEALPPPSPPEPPPAARAAQTSEVEPTLQLAEIMLSMGLEEGAAQTLIEYTEANPRHAIYHWLKLLGIYRSRGLQKEFAATAEKLRRYFNIQAAEWGKPLADGAQTLENFTRITEHVQKIWTQPEECIGYLRRLLEDNRDGARAGFPQSVAEEILFLVEVQKMLTGPGQPSA